MSHSNKATEHVSRGMRVEKNGQSSGSMVVHTFWCNKRTYAKLYVREWLLSEKPICGAHWKKKKRKALVKGIPLIEARRSTTSSNDFHEWQSLCLYALIYVSVYTPKKGRFDWLMNYPLVFLSLSEMKKNWREGKELLFCFQAGIIKELSAWIKKKARKIGSFIVSDGDQGVWLSRGESVSFRVTCMCLNVRVYSSVRSRGDSRKKKKIIFFSFILSSEQPNSVVLLL